MAGPFVAGELIDVNGNDEEGFTGSWCEAVVVEPGENEVLVQYLEFLADGGGHPLREKLPRSRLRPAPPLELSRFKSIRDLQLGHSVDAYYDDIWWKGVVVFLATAGVQVNLSGAWRGVDREQLEAAHYLLRPFMLRRLKEEVEVRLPPRLETRIHCPLSAMQTFWYRRLLLRDCRLLADLEAGDEQAKGHTAGSARPGAEVKKGEDGRGSVILVLEGHKEFAVVGSQVAASLPVNFSPPLWEQPIAHGGRQYPGLRSLVDATGGAVITLRAGDMLLMPPRVFHLARNCAPTVSCNFSVCTMQSVPLTLAQTLARMEQSPTDLMHFDSDCTRLLVDCTAALIKEARLRAAAVEAAAPVLVRYPLLYVSDNPKSSSDVLVGSTHSWSPLHQHSPQQHLQRAPRQHSFQPDRSTGNRRSPVSEELASAFDDALPPYASPPGSDRPGGTPRALSGGGLRAGSCEAAAPT
ncbi:SWI/SNF-related matrix-associated actin-dependent regulator of chromatin subfamily A member 5, partial [Tetrabaena socialis]